MGILSGDPKKQPLHYGEIASIWAYLLAAKSNWEVRPRKTIRKALLIAIFKMAPDKIDNSPDNVHHSAYKF